ncbi:hypothetical protein ACOME3_009507 [Neoechinorhynchus agilis]
MDGVSVHQCMAQYTRVFFATRIPDQSADQLTISKRSLQGTPISIAVMYKSQVNIVELEFAELQCPCGFEAAIECIVHGATKEPDNRIGLLTALDRDDWYTARSLISSICDRNKQNFKLIDNSAFVLCIDDDGDVDEEGLECSMLQLLCGGRKGRYNSNRYYDKCMQVIIGESGLVGMNFEHSFLDGVVMIDIVKKALETRSFCCEPRHGYKPKVLSLTFHFIPLIQCFYGKAYKISETIATKLNLKHFEFTKCGKIQLKKLGVSPDAFLQLAIQISYYRIYEIMACPYESASLRRFQEGRIEVIRSASSKIRDLCMQYGNKNGKLFDTRLLRSALREQALKIRMV